MATIASLNVALSADTARFHSGMQKAAGSLKSLSTAINPITVSLAAVGYAGAKAFGEMSAAIARASDLVDQAAKLNVGAEELAALRYSAKQAGVEVGALDKGLEQFNKRLGKGQNAEALERIGLSAERLKKLSLTDALLEVVDSLRLVSNEADQAAIAVDVFGRSGQDLTNFINLGSEAIKLQRQEAEALGVVLREDAAKGLEELGDAQERVSGAWEGAWNAMTVSLGEFIAAAADITAEILTLGKAVTMGFNGTELVLKKANAEIRQYHADQKRAQEVAAAMAATQAKQNTEIETATQRLTQETAAREQLTKATAEHDKRVTEAARKQEQITERIRTDAQAVFEATRTPQEALSIEMEKLNELLELGALSWDLYSRAAREAVKSFDDANQIQPRSFEMQSAAPAALEKGSSGAISAVNQGRSDLKRIADLNRLALAEGQQQTRYLQQIAAAAGVNVAVANF